MKLIVFLLLIGWGAILGQARVSEDGHVYTNTQVNVNLNIKNPENVEYLIKHRNTRELIQSLKTEARNEKQNQLVKQIETILNQVEEQIGSRQSNKPVNVKIKFENLDRLRSLVDSEEGQELFQKVKVKVPEEQFQNLSIVDQAIRQALDQMEQEE